MTLITRLVGAVGLLIISALPVLHAGCSVTGSPRSAPATQPTVRSPAPGASEAAQRAHRGYVDVQPMFRRSDAGTALRRAESGVTADEIWVVQRERVDVQPEDKDQARSGALLAKLPGKSEQVAIPLKHTDVRASITGYIASVDVKQQYHNPYDSKIEAVYMFPLPSDAAVNEFVMTIGDRHIRGIIREREEAQKIYAEAKSQGYVASLLVQDRPNVFTQSVANIEPGKAIDIDITYFHTLSYIDGWFEFVFPMVVGPRFNPPHTTDGIGAKGHGAAVGVSGQKTEVSYLKPDQRSGHDISLSVDLDAGVEIEQLDSRNHRVETKSISESRKHIAIARDDTIPNKDFVLRYKVAGERVKTAMFTQRDPKDPNSGYFALMVYPPESLKGLPRKPLEMVFTIDVSGSMSGQPIEQAKAAARYALSRTEPGDSFQIVSFASSASQMSAQPLPATRENVARGLDYLKTMNEGGGTMMIEGIRRSLNFPRDPERLRFVAFLTDGYIGNEREILRALKQSLADSRVFSFGVGSSTNRYLLDSMAQLGNGASAYLDLNDDAERVMADYFERIAHPALTNLKLDFGQMRVSDVYPREMPDLFVGRPVIVTGRFTGGADVTVRIAGKVGGEARSFDIPIASSDTAEHRAISTVWARRKIADIADRSIYEDDTAASAPMQIKETALEYGLISAFTSFVAVDSSQRTAGAEGTTVAVPVPVPDGVKYQTTVKE